MERETLTEGAIKILEMLSIYQFMTADQIVRSGVSKNIKSVREKLLSQLIKRKPPLIEVQEFGVIPTIGRLSRMYCLNHYGAEALGETLKRDPQAIPYPKGKIQFANDYFHRKAFIDFHIGVVSGYV